MSMIPVTGDSTAAVDLICLSHLRWNFVFQRPQHLMTRCARDRRVFFVEEPIEGSTRAPDLQIERSHGVTVVVPRLPAELPASERDDALRRLIDQLIVREEIAAYALWYYTPMALAFTDHLSPVATVYDCMDELAAFKGASSLLSQYEAELMTRASLVLTGGQSLFEAKRHLHSNIHPFPSSVDIAHFAQARRIVSEPGDQAHIPRPRLGFFGVIDERMDVALLDAVAEARPDWHLVMVGPVVKIDPASLPRRANIHYLGSKSYGELPQYLAGWDVALLPFARNAATRFISPTKTPEYMAAGKPVVSTSIRDVVRAYGKRGLVRIADDAPSFVAACLEAMGEDASVRMTQADAFLRHTSWDGTWTRIRVLFDKALRGGAADGAHDFAGGAAAV
jgi:UDP-galactopyranose mutase